MTKKLSEQRKAKNKAARALAKLGQRTLMKAENSKHARLALFDYHKHNHKPPKVVIVVPVRDRNEQKKMISSYYKKSIQLKILFVNQNWNLPFNRGAMMNIGFLEVKKLYPDCYQNITFVFHDVDIIPYSGMSIKAMLSRFVTSSGTIKHIFGFRHSLGGIFSIMGVDFELIGGSSNCYGWNIEDVILQERAKAHNLTIDRSPSHFVDVDNGGKAINLSYNVPFQPEYRTYFISEWERNKKEDTINSLTTYTVENEGYNTYVSYFKTSHNVQLNKTNIRVCSTQPLPSILLPKQGIKNEKDDERWFITQWSEKLHGKQFEEELQSKPVQ